MPIGKAMPMKQRDPQQSDQSTQLGQQLATALGSHVMEALGRPRDLQRVQVRQVWEGHYRVNIFVGVDLASAKVAHSFFVATDDDGKIVTSTPKIGRRY